MENIHWISITVRGHSTTMSIERNLRQWYWLQIFEKHYALKATAVFGYLKNFTTTLFFKYTEKTVSLNQRNISLIYGQRKNFFELKKFLVIQKKFLWSKEIDLFRLKNIFLNQPNFLQFKEIYSLTVYQRNVSLTQWNCFLGVK